MIIHESQLQAYIYSYIRSSLVYACEWFAVTTQCSVKYLFLDDIKLGNSKYLQMSVVCIYW